MPSRGVWIPHFVPIIHMYWSLQVIPHCGYCLKAKANYRWWDLPSRWLILRLPNQISPSTMYPLMTPPSVRSLCWKFCWGFWNLHMLRSVYSLCLSMGEWRSFMRFTWRWIWTCLAIASCTVVKRTPCSAPCWRLPSQCIQSWPCVHSCCCTHPDLYAPDQPSCRQEWCWMGHIPDFIAQYPLVGCHHSERKLGPVLGHLYVQRWGLSSLKSALWNSWSGYLPIVLFTAGLVSPLMTELAMVSWSIEGIGC